MKKELRRGRRVWIVIGMAIVLVLAFYTPIFSQTVPGQTMQVLSQDRGGITNFQLKVKLDSGNEVVVFASPDTDHRVNAKVEITKTTSVFGMSTYQFLRYVE